MRTIHIDWGTYAATPSAKTFTMTLEKDGFNYIRSYHNNASFISVAYELSLLNYFPDDIGAFFVSHAEVGSNSVKLFMKYKSIFDYKATTKYASVERLCSVLRLLHNSDIVHRQIDDDTIVKTYDANRSEVYAFCSYANFAFLKQDPVSIRRGLFSIAGEKWTKKHDIIDLGTIILRLSLGMDVDAFIDVKNLLNINTRAFFESSRYRIIDHNLYNLAKFILQGGVNAMPDINQICSFMGMRPDPRVLGTKVIPEECVVDSVTADIINSACGFVSKMNSGRSAGYFCEFRRRGASIADRDLAIISKKMVLDLFTDIPEKDCESIETIDRSSIIRLFEQVNGRFLFDIAYV